MDTDGKLSGKYHVGETHLFQNPRLATNELLQVGDAERPFLSASPKKKRGRKFIFVCSLVTGCTWK